MPEEYLNSLPEQEDQNRNDTPGNSNEDNLSDTQKIVRQHMEDKDHVITEEEMAKIRIGVASPEFDEATQVRFEGRDAREQKEEEILGNRKKEEDENLEDKRITPWDTIDPS
jgi:hypothetical protein